MPDAFPMILFVKRPRPHSAEPPESSALRLQPSTPLSALHQQQRVGAVTVDDETQGASWAEVLHIL